ncbi:dentin sialophosphoprotein-like [Uloborus diversus]|uniref:dentin sialophosphoprotein-like n=1 Tax=Uloborus diversus TaxID=327109 RepID=UPI00240A3D67|nr:dentin sialophosphoprotein-like [Uloborus diversus]
MDTIRHPIEASLTRTRGAIMEDRYRRLHHEQAIHQYWSKPPTQAVALNRFKRHLPAIPKRKGKDSAKKSDNFDVATYAKHYKDKYGSVSAHSTSAIYGALRVPHYHAVYGVSDMWYASVRSLNRGCHRDVVYSAEAYEWRETLYEDVPKEAYALPPREMMPRLPCGCMGRRRPSNDGPSSRGKSSRHHHPRCKNCTSALPKNGSSNGVPPNAKRTMVVPDKLKPAVTSENSDNKPEATSRMSGYRKCIPGASKYSLAYNKGASTKEPGMISRKSILECDVTAYDLIKKVSKTPSVTEIDDSDVDDNLSDNAIARMNQSRLLKFQSKCKISSPTSGTPRQIANKKLSAKVKKAQSENCIYSDSHSVLVGGQRIFTDNHRPKSPDLLFNHDSSEIGQHYAEDSNGARWRRMSASEESVCIPDPDYDFSDESDDETVINASCMDPKFTYSPPPIRKSFDDLRPNLGQNSRELSKSMSSLLSDDTYVPSINLNNCDRSYTPEIAAEQFDCDNDLVGRANFSISNGSHENLYDDEDDYSPSTSNGKQMQSLKQETKYESSSDCSSSGGTLSSDYPTWTSSSSNELKSILKKKKRRESAIFELEDTNRVEREKLDAKEAQRKKQVQFRPGWEKSIRTDSLGDDAYDSDTRDIDENTNYTDSNNSTVINDTYETIAEASNDRNCSTESQDILKTNDIDDFTDFTETANNSSDIHSDDDY